MKTESLVRQERRDDPLALSRALQDTSPLHCVLVDSRGNPVPLSAAGYVLRPGRLYRAQLISPFKDSELKEVKIIGPPEFITVEPELKDVDDEGRDVHSLTIRVKGEWWSRLKKLGLFDVRSDELEIAHYFADGSAHRMQPFRCPVVVRSPWLSLFFAMLGSLVVVFGERLVSEALWTGQIPVGGVRSLFRHVLTDGHSWYWIIGLGVVAFFTARAINAGLLYRRCRELRQQFREAYPPSPPPTD